MAREKAIRTRLLTITGISASTRVAAFGTVDGSGAISSPTPNPFVKDVMWDSVAYVAGVSMATGGSYSIQVEGTVAGVTGCPIAYVEVAAGDDQNVILDNVCNSAASPIPTHVTFTDLIGGGEVLDGGIDVVAKSSRGELANGPTNQHRVIEGTLINVSNFAASATHDLTRTVLGATWASFRGLDKATIWDNASFWAFGSTSTGGSWSAAVICTIGGNTFTLAEVDAQPTGATWSSTGKFATGSGTRAAMGNKFYGCAPQPSQIIFTEGTATGVSELKVVFMAKTRAGGPQRRR